MTSKDNVQALAKAFLAIADELSEKVTAYFNGSDKAGDIEAYWKVREADKAFIDALNDYYDDSYEYGLNYELAETFI